ncbi:MAG: DUF1385 domain-containing protein [Anaerolineae bacterium CG_4_9_14_3_um_filter_57_17]|nr:DUF1385 domain-containing protein [bacterium]NCT21708.1 DUF1385 domain-containing protein [bacterium]OIO84540.1 MAG: hypothetical protein AUK01_08985 [Anaerolineae bacterium CG2_30_57_67]PJB66498.1 MAG: DUF1385 domain-containing protein [Anaerolineae bacterium CG_4_9_14_3_um_filter_57_17]
MEDKIITYGGQALIEGVLMRGQKALAIAMRAPNGEIVVHTEKLSGLYQSAITKIPFLRGVILLWDALGLGMKALTISANTQSGEDEKLEGAALYGTLAFSMAFAVGLFFLAPYGLSRLAVWLMGSLGAEAASTSIWLSAVIEGVVRLLLVIGYIWGIGQMDDIRRVFQYHGAEHKTINAYEAGVELTPENVAKFPLEHPRCGTSFLLTLVLLSVIAFSFLHPLPALWQIFGRILLIPILAGVALEYIRWTANHLDQAWVRALIAPNLALQSLTTREPDLKILEVGIRAFQAMRAAEEAANN